MEFEALYKKVRGIVLKYRKQYVLRGWELSDWEQEGMLNLYELLHRHPELSKASHQERLLVYFKVRFGNYIKDKLRKQESQKRQFDRMPYEEVSEISHRISSKGLMNDDLVALRGQLRQFKASLGREGEELYQKLLSGERFKGRKEMERRLSQYLEDFREL
ncbi:sigma-70 family RNA polymerase sigma factor [Streptococcus gallinaceus]|uniref:sigma-70 family RNA polymerase sigma factor n=1 Tax=Streptococcus gallinaceus TaxID=165758 RepID=UPI0033922845